MADRVDVATEELDLLLVELEVTVDSGLSD